ncbi:hypothetical protein Acsp04_44020 [Actinomadura sp. NBRC 104425]|nr:hypothetical protein Acsp04_44020 [Actinomadura sp. NBRC 104425]
MELGKIDTASVREWRAALIEAGVGASDAAKAYRFLRAVLMTAADDLIIPRNPCRIRGAGEEKPDERPVLTVAQVFKLADLMPEHLRAVVLLATFASLRWGEVAALRRMDLDVEAGTVSVRQAQVELDTGELLIGQPKSRAGVRTVALPPVHPPGTARTPGQAHGPEQTALVFTRASGAATCDGPTSGERPGGATRWPRSARPACTFMTFGTPATCSLPRRARACGTSWSA